MLHPSQSPYLAAMLLSGYLAVVYTIVRYLHTRHQRRADLEEMALTPETILGELALKQQQQAWPVDHGQDIPQGDASSLPVNRVMQQPRDQGSNQQDMKAIFESIYDLKVKLYGSTADVSIQAQHDLAIAAAEIDRHVSSNIPYCCY